MFTTQQNPLPGVQQEEFSKWLAMGEMKTLLDVLEGKALVLEVEATIEFAQSGKFPKKTDQGMFKLEQAKEYRDAIAAIKKISEQPKHATVTLTTQP